MKVGDLFSGAGDMALEISRARASGAGMECASALGQKPEACQTFEANLPGKVIFLTGTNSSGKTSGAQLLPMFKQAVDTLYRDEIHSLSGQRSIVGLWTLTELIHVRDPQQTLSWDMAWDPTEISENFLNADYISDLEVAFVEFFDHMHCLCPLRDYPRFTHIVGWEQAAQFRADGRKNVRCHDRGGYRASAPRVRRSGRTQDPRGDRRRLAHKLMPHPLLRNSAHYPVASLLRVCLRRKPDDLAVSSLQFIIIEA